MLGVFLRTCYFLRTVYCVLTGTDENVWRDQKRADRQTNVSVHRERAVDEGSRVCVYCLKKSRLLFAVKRVRGRNTTTVRDDDENVSIDTVSRTGRGDGAHTATARPGDDGYHRVFRTAWHHMCARFSHG